MPEEALTDQAKIVLVPILRPQATRDLVRLALALAHPDDGQVIVLVVSKGDAEQEVEELEQITAAVQEFQEDGQPVQLASKRSSTISRGILDSAREKRADLLLLGGYEPTRGGVSLGTVPENVIPAAPCEVVLYRSGASHEHERIVIPILDNEQVRIASRIAILLGQRLDVPVEALYVQDDTTSSWEARGQAEGALVGLPGEEKVKRTIIRAQNKVSGYLSRLDSNDLAVVGFSEQSQWERRIRGDASVSLLKKWSGALIIVASASAAAPTSRPARIRRWLTPTLTKFEQEEVERNADESAATSLDYIVLIIVAAILASLGLLLNSNAVIIGAMLVAPLMSPLIAFATGMTVGKIDLARRSTGTLLQGILGALLISLLIGLLSPTSIVTSEMASRGNPTFLDLGVALVSGFLGAYATARKDIPSALAGVAIAAALMPPLTTIGLALAFGEVGLAEGATLLFLTNIVSIILAAWATFVWLGMRPGEREDARSTRRTSAVLVGLFLIVLAGLVFQRASGITTARVERILQESFQESQLVSFDVRQTEPLRVVATVRRLSSNLNDNSEVITAQAALEEGLNRAVQLDVIVQAVVNGEVATTDAEIGAAIEQTLEQALQHSSLIEFTFEVGNPTVVVAIVQTEVEPGSEEFQADITAAEEAMRQQVALPVELIVLAAESDATAEEIESTNLYLSELIEQTLIESLQYSQLIDFTFLVGNPFVINITVITDADPTPEEFNNDIRQAEAALFQALGLPVVLNADVVPIAGQAGAPPVATDSQTPTPTIEPPPNPTATEEIATPAPTDEPPPPSEGTPTPSEGTLTPETTEEAPTPTPSEESQTPVATEETAPG